MSEPLKAEPILTVPNLVETDLLTVESSEIKFVKDTFSSKYQEVTILSQNEISLSRPIKIG